MFKLILPTSLTLMTMLMVIHTFVPSQIPQRWNIIWCHISKIRLNLIRSSLTNAPIVVALHTLGDEERVDCASNVLLIL